MTLDSDVAGQGRSAKTPWTSPASYWIPEYVVDSAWLGHAPFAAWLLEQTRPRTVVELGTHQGFSYFAMCDFAQRLGLGTSFAAVDTWQGDEHAGFYSSAVFDAVSRWNERFLPRSSLMRMTFAEARGDIDDRSVDLLHIDGRHRYEDVVQDFALYAGTLSERGVVLFHDIAERGGDFGVHRFWSELTTRFPTFSFDHSHGLGVALVGSVQPSALRSLASAGDFERAAVRTVYENLGSRVSGVRDLLVQVDEAQSSVRALEEKAAQWEARAMQLGTQIEELKGSTSWRVSAPVRWLGSAVRRSRVEGNEK